MSEAIIVDVEADGPYPGDYSMISIGACSLNRKSVFYTEVKPIGTFWSNEALAVSGWTREKHLQVTTTPIVAMSEFDRWLSYFGKVTMWSDNPAWDFQWINHYFMRFLSKNPFGHSARRIGDLASGVENDLYFRWKYLRDTKHTHNPLDDAKGNAEALEKIFNAMDEKRSLSGKRRC